MIFKFGSSATNTSACATSVVSNIRLLIFQGIAERLADTKHLNAKIFSTLGASRRTVARNRSRFRALAMSKFRCLAWASSANSLVSCANNVRCAWPRLTASSKRSWTLALCQATSFFRLSEKCAVSVGVLAWLARSDLTSTAASSVALRRPPQELLKRAPPHVRSLWRAVVNPSSDPG